MSEYLGTELELSSLTLPLPPSCVAFSPEHSDLVVIGTYFLDKNEDHSEATTTANDEQPSQAHGPQTRSGSLILFRLTDGKLNQLSTTSSASGILDIAFSPHDPSLLCAATSTGSLTFHRLSQTSLDHIYTLHAFDPSILVLDLEFHPTLPSTIGVTLSTGDTGLVHITNSSPPSVESVDTLHTHSLEAWTLAFSPCGKHTYSGSDAATLHLSPAGVTDSRTHGAGVTAILPLAVDDAEGRHLLMTGSYDDTLRILAVQPGRRTQALLDLDLGGGVWRLRPMTANDGTWVVLASCMHAGAAVVRVTCSDWGGDRQEWSAEVLQRFTKHQSMNYGSDVVPIAEGKWTVVSSSFYDKLVCVWEVCI